MIASHTTPSVLRQVPGSSGLEVLTWPAFDDLDVDVQVTTRRGGVSAGPYASLNLSLNVGDDPAHVLENRRRALAALGPAWGMAFSPSRCTVRRPRWSAWRIGAAAPGPAPTPYPPPTLWSRPILARCWPCWPPTACRSCSTIRSRTCSRAPTRAGGARSPAPLRPPSGPWCRWAARPANLVVGLGPAIAPGRYRVGAEVAEAAEKAFGERASAVLHPAGPEQWRFDLWTANRMVLQAAGVPSGQIHGTATATGPITPAPGPTSGSPASPAPSTPASPVPSTPASPAASTATSLATATSAAPTAPQPPDGWFFSHRAEQPCGRFGLLARLRPRESR